MKVRRDSLLFFFSSIYWLLIDPRCDVKEMRYTQVCSLASVRKYYVIVRLCETKPKIYKRQVTWTPSQRESTAVHINIILMGGPEIRWVDSEWIMKPTLSPRIFILFSQHNFAQKKITWNIFKKMFIYHWLKSIFSPGQFQNILLMNIHSLCVCDTHVEMLVCTIFFSANSI